MSRTRFFLLALIPLWFGHDGVRGQDYVPIHLPAIQIPQGPVIPVVWYVPINDLRINAADRPDEDDLVPVALAEWVDDAGCTHTFIRVDGKNVADIQCPVQP